MEEKAVISKDKLQRKETPINRLTTEDGCSKKRRNRRTEQETEAQSGHKEAIETEEQ